jgi:hypothetical protein
LWWSDFKKVHIPLSEITSISCQAESWHGIPHLPKWMGHLGPTQIIIKTAQPETLAQVPVSKHGRGRLMVEWQDRAAAQQLVDTIALRSPLPQARPFWGGKRFAERPANLQSIRMKLLGPGLGLFLSGLVGVVASFAWAVANIGKTFHDGLGSVHPWLALGAFPVLAGTVLQCIGAVRMMRVESYLWAVIAAILGLLPWSPSWVLGLPCSIWALVVLSRPEVMAAFLGERRGLATPAVDTPAPPAAGKGRLRAFFHSVGRYCFTRFSGRQATSNQAGAERLPENVISPLEQPIPHQPVTIDYTPEPGDLKSEPPQK